MIKATTPKIDLEKGTIELTIFSMTCPCGEKFKSADQKELKQKAKNHYKKCNVFKFIKDLAKNPDFKDRPLSEILKELGWSKAKP
jgi:hypothetical protein